jgi:hypothetical protein
MSSPTITVGRWLMLVFGKLSPSPHGNRRGFDVLLPAIVVRFAEAIHVREKVFGDTKHVVVYPLVIDVEQTFEVVAESLEDSLFGTAPAGAAGRFLCGLLVDSSGGNLNP